MRHTEVLKIRKPSFNQGKNFQIETVKKGQLLNTNFIYSTYYKHPSTNEKDNSIKSKKSVHFN